jgi:hypothetical protein
MGSFSLTFRQTYDKKLFDLMQYHRTIIHYQKMLLDMAVWPRGIFSFTFLCV